MSQLELISVLVYLIYLIRLSDCSDPSQPIIVTTHTNNNFTANEFTTLHLRVEDIPSDTITGNCSGICAVNSRQLPLKCRVGKHNFAEYIDVFLKNNITREDSGQWDCVYLTRRRHSPSLNENTTEDNGQTYSYFQQTARFRLDVKFEGNYWWYFIGAGIAIIVLLIIIGQTICIIHFRRKAVEVRRHANLSKREQTLDDTVRYSASPASKKTGVEVRESGIYEVLENVRAALVPRPPSLTTLPRVKASPTLPLPAPPKDPKVAVAGSLPRSFAGTLKDSLQRTFTNGVPMPFGGSLARNQTTPKKSDNSEDKRSSAERVRDRLPMPIPTDEEVYEVMEQSPAPLKKEIKKNEVFRGYVTQPRMPSTPAPLNHGHAVQTLPPRVLNSELQHAFNVRKRLNTHAAIPESSTMRIESPPSRVIPCNPGLPPPRPEPAPSGPSGIPRSGRPLPPNLDAIKYRPPPPVKPKQLHPLPPPPQPESLYVSTERNDGGSSDEEWTYEPIPAYNIYSI